MTNSSLPKSRGVGAGLSQISLDIRPGSQLLLQKISEHQNQDLPKVSRSQNLTSLLAAIILILLTTLKLHPIVCASTAWWFLNWHSEIWLLRDKTGILNIQKSGKIQRDLVNWLSLNLPPLIVVTLQILLPEFLVQLNGCKRIYKEECLFSHSTTFFIRWMFGSHICDIYNSIDVHASTVRTSLATIKMMKSRK